MTQVIIRCIVLLILFGCQSNKHNINIVKPTTNKQINIKAVNTKKHIFKRVKNDTIIQINNDIETYSLNKQNRLGYKVVVNQDMCTIVFSIEYFLQQKAKQNRTLDLQEMKLNIGFHF